MALAAYSSSVEDSVLPAAAGCANPHRHTVLRIVIKKRQKKFTISRHLHAKMHSENLLSSYRIQIRCPLYVAIYSYFS
jgi:hypothetical protein